MGSELQFTQSPVLDRSGDPEAPVQSFDQRAKCSVRRKAERTNAVGL